MIKMSIQIVGILSIIVCLYTQNASAIRGNATFYNLGMTACGRVYNDGQMVAAVGVPHWKGGNPNKDPICGRHVTVKDVQSGKTVRVEIQDKCMSCGYNNIDLSPVAFRQLRSESVGKFQVDWNFS